MDTKKHLINLRQRWDALYQTTMECEVKTEVGLKPLQKFQVVCDEFEKWLETVEEKLERQMIKVGSTQELKQQLEACQVLTMLYVPMFHDVHITVVYTRCICYRLYVKLASYNN